MSNAAAQLVAAFESLPPKEQHEVMTVLLKRSGELLDHQLSDNDLVGLADELFQTLDADPS